VWIGTRRQGDDGSEIRSKIQGKVVQGVVGLRMHQVRHFLQSGIGSVGVHEEWSWAGGCDPVIGGRAVLQRGVGVW
jgi:hypothetical protein